jgi:predicted metal-dependent phosphoesterase TrpH
MKADLHSHTTFSDGKYTVDELLDYAILNNLDMISITDHDCFDGSILASKTDKNIKVIFGMELSTYRNDESVHILGYFKSLDNIKVIQPILDDQVAKRKIRALAMLEKLNQLFQIKLDPQFIYDTESVTRGSIAREIIKQGYPYTNREIFQKMIGDDSLAYIPSTKRSTKEGIDLIHKCGGLAVLAHPMELKKNKAQDIIDLGVDGIEAIYPNRKSEEGLYRELAKKNNLFITGGSDFHTFNDGRHGNIGQVYLSGEDLEIFLKVLYEH